MSNKLSSKTNDEAEDQSPFADLCLMAGITFSMIVIGTIGVVFAIPYHVISELIKWIWRGIKHYSLYYPAD
jgi:hypothetical protein